MSAGQVAQHFVKARYELRKVRMAFRYAKRHPANATYWFAFAVDRLTKAEAHRAEARRLRAEEICSTCGRAHAVARGEDGMGPYIAIHCPGDADGNDAFYARMRGPYRYPKEAP